MSILPRILIIDDLYGRTVSNRRNEQRSDLCAQFLLNDVTGDEDLSERRIKKPVAEAVFYRGQTPVCAQIGDFVENNIEDTIHFIDQGWDKRANSIPRWTLILLDLCFYTGFVTRESDHNTTGMAEGQPGDDVPSSYFGLKLLKIITKRFPDLPVVLLSSMDKESVAREYSQLGALGFLPKSDSNATEILQKTIWREGLIEDNSGRLIGHSLPLLLALRKARRASDKRDNVLFIGESGTGKELIVPYLHEQQELSKNTPLIKFNCGALSQELSASDLFGHVKGSFTGSVGSRVGLIQEADSGDLFMDEIGNMPYSVQGGLLRAIEQRVITPVGTSKTINVDVRFLSATNTELEGSNRFRQDLYARLYKDDGGLIRLPALRDRMEDIPILVESFVRQAEAREVNPTQREIESESIDKLCSYNWHRYNIRELRSVIFNSISQYASLDYLSPNHIILPTEKNKKSTISFAEEKKQPKQKTSLKSEIPSFEELLENMSAFSFKNIPEEELVAKQPMLEKACATISANYLNAVLVATRQRTVKHPEGELKIHPALKLATGDVTLTASKAADKIKKVFAMPNFPEDLIDKNKSLKWAKEKALKLRPRKGKSNK